MRDCHARNIYHGDIKTENVLVTSWNWLYLTDFSSSYKPTYLPEDNPADFSFFFDLSGRRTCYLAPERFLAPGSQAGGEQTVTWAMDIFSVGCVIAELFLEAPIFSLSQLFKYRQREYDPSHAHLSKIQDESIRELVCHMIQLDPNSRCSADDYLTFWKGKAFPHYFYGFLQQYMHSITDPTSGRKPVTTAAEHLGEPDDRIEQIYNDFDKISILLAGHETSDSVKPKHAIPKPNSKLFPLSIDIPNYYHQASPAPNLAVDDGNLIFLTIVVSCLRGTARATARLRGFELLLAFSGRLTDEAKLDRVVPYVANLLTDKSDQVRIAALRTMTQVLAMVQVVSPVNAYIFPEYILLRLEPFLLDSSMQSSPLIRMQYAWSIGTLASTAARYLDMIQALRVDGSLPTSDPEAENDVPALYAQRNQFDTDRENLLAAFEKHTKGLLTDPDAGVRRAVLRSVSELCVFFGSPRANDVVLSHLNTYLNDRDWMLKCAFFDAIVGVAVFVGGASLEGFILPLMVQALTDPEEFVVEKVVRAFSAIADLGLFQRSKTWELVDIVARLTMHPNLWIREAAAQFISAASKYLSVADTHSILVHLIRPYLKVVPADFTELRILDCLKKSLPRLVMDMASNWAAQVEKGIFWIPAKQQQTFTFGLAEDALPTVSGQELDAKILARTPKNEEDEQWLRKLRNAGMTADDEFKLVALRDFIWRVTQRRRMDDPGASSSRFSSIVALKDLDIIPQTVLFDNGAREVIERAQQQAQDHQAAAPRTIADALLDASTTEASGNRKDSKSAQGGEGLSKDAPKGKPIDVPAQKGLSISTGAARSAQSSSLPDADVRRNSLQVPRASPLSQSPVGSLIAGEHSHALRHRGSAKSLLHKDGNKALAEIGTTSTTAFGKVDGSTTRETSRTRQLPAERQRSPAGSRFKDAHNYTGNDPTVLKLLDSILLERFPSDETEFGPRVQPNVRRQPIKHKESHQSAQGSIWRPEGILVATFGEHTAAVTRILVAPSNAFFITGSDDGTVKVWDTSRLERNVSRKSRLTYRLGEGVRVSSLVFVEQTYCFVATGTDGSVHVVRIEYYQQEKDSSGRFGRVRVLRQYELEEGDYAVWSEHFNEDNKSVLLMATQTSKIIALDLRTMTELYRLNNPLHHGTPTCFCVDRKHQWLVLGTSHGVLDLWDLRFKLRLKGWAFHGAAPIHRLVLPKTKRPRVYVASGTGQGEVTVWDLEKLVCKEVYRTGTSRDSGSKSTTLIDLDEEQAGGMLGRFATSLEPTANSSNERGIRALVVTSQALEEGGEAKHTFLLTAGPDWKVRYWDMHRNDASMVVSGLAMDEAKPQYTTSQPSPDTTVVTERLSQPQGGQAQHQHQQQQQQQQQHPSGGRDSRTSNTSAKRGGQKAASTSTSSSSRTGLISLQQQQLLRSHLDTVMDVALIELPYGMVVSADRAGVVYMFM